MQLLNDFFHIEKSEMIEDSYVCSIQLNRNHLIYQAHFPNNPITPGACLLQIMAECLEVIIGKKLCVEKIKSVKFLSILSPIDVDRVTIHYNKLVQSESECKAQIIIKSEETQYVKVAISYVYGQS
ncbi:hydroxymyristoyl-ACP dehydratase [Odoribacter sp. OttesenSCG-928-J03]|nr:hydroxymyristoyl-ACP dehydratase [Odoribacter sp. OttesenSCG-928-J03]MDL2331243.1 hydroxymyristoyl-ACP dehydratase [Odoribacter sp. OttesenSCG-928-A06]